MTDGSISPQRNEEVTGNESAEPLGSSDGRLNAR